MILKLAIASDRIIITLLTVDTIAIHQNIHEYYLKRILLVVTG